MEDDYNLDKVCWDRIEEDISSTVSWFLMANYAYHIQDDPILSNSIYDRMCRKLYREWNNVDHKHKHFINKNDLELKKHLGKYPEKIDRGIEHVKEAYYGRAKRV